MAFIPGLGPMELIVLLILGVLLFGRRLPDVGRYFGRAFMKHKNGVRGRNLDLFASPPGPESGGELGKALLVLLLICYAIALLGGAIALKYAAD